MKDKIHIPSESEDAEITSVANNDPDSPTLSEADFTRMKRVRGAQVKPTKKQVTLRLNTAIIDKLKEDGAGWQTRLNDILESALKV